MSDAVLRHFIAAMATILFGLTYLAAYISGGLGWWWSAFGILAVYAIVYKFVDA